MTWTINRSGPRATVNTQTTSDCDGFIGQVLMKTSQKAAILAAIDGTPGDVLVAEAAGTMSAITLLDVRAESGGGPGDGDEGP